MSHKLYIICNWKSGFLLGYDRNDAFICNWRDLGSSFYSMGNCETKISVS